MAGLRAGSGGGFDYIQSAEPADPENAELWFDTDGGTDGNGQVKVYDGSQWDTTGYVSHDQLTNVSPGDHFTPGSGLSFSAGALQLLLSEYLTIDGNGDIAVASGSLGQDRLAFDTATQSELSSHTNNSNAHHSKPTQVSGVLVNQSGEGQFSNSSGTVMFVTAKVSGNGAGAELRIYVDGNELIESVSTVDNSSETVSGSVMVPPGSSYEVEGARGYVTQHYAVKLGVA
ncbi:hypothetical protein [Haloarcula argentinensis]|uniref:Uncharacterized protein n=1 Tax=Haloarcula argentinensis TaxID=43776 RepID=A0A847UKG3_HALAR|nr:hypothetical protein [Haloarcula argentinensis]NLV14425.1 hypothetical protein [Haloarcula argentinensis]